MCRSFCPWGGGQHVSQVTWPGGLHPGGSASVGVLYPEAGLPLGICLRKSASGGGVCIQRDCADSHPIGYYGIRLTSGRHYTSYWKAFLFINKNCLDSMLSKWNDIHKQHFCYRFLTTFYESCTHIHSNNYMVISFASKRNIYLHAMSMLSLYFCTCRSQMRWFVRVYRSVTSVT